MAVEQLARREFLKRIGVGASATGFSITGFPIASFSQTRQRAPPTEQDRLRNVVLSYLAQPKFRTPDFLEQLTGTKAELRVYNLDEDMLYFSIPAEQFNEQTTLANLAKRPNLEQTNVDYRMLYGHLGGEGHITVAVEGNFGNRNGLSFNMGGKTYSIAETTALGFRIGESLFAKPFGIENIKHIQKSGPNSVIYDARSDKPLPFIR